RISSQREGEYDLRHGASWANDEYPWAMVTGLKMQREISWKRCLERFADALRTGCRTALPSRPAFQDGSGEPSYGAYATPRRTALKRLQELDQRLPFLGRQQWCTQLLGTVKVQQQFIEGLCAAIMEIRAAIEQSAQGRRIPQAIGTSVGLELNIIIALGSVLVPLMAPAAAGLSVKEGSSLCRRVAELPT